MVGNIKICISSMGERILQIQILQATFFIKNPEMTQLTLTCYLY